MAAETVIYPIDVQSHALRRSRSVTLPPQDTGHTYLIVIRIVGLIRRAQIRQVVAPVRDVRRACSRVRELVKHNASLAVVDIINVH